MYPALVRWPAWQASFLREWCGQILTLKMTPMKTLMLLGCLVGLFPSTFAQTKAPKPISAAEAKNHVGEMASVCGKVVDAKVAEVGVARYGRPVTLYLDQPEPNPVFYFITFGAAHAKPGDSAAAYDVVPTYKEKKACVPGKITSSPTGPYIMAADRSQIKLQEEPKK
jgi:hypothetical protein